LKGLAQHWFEKWLEQDVLIPDTRKTSPVPSTPEEEKLTTAIINRNKVRFHTLEKDRLTNIYNIAIKNLDALEFVKNKVHIHQT
jgi:hypothetical protein